MTKLQKHRLAQRRASHRYYEKRKQDPKFRQRNRDKARSWARHHARQNAKRARLYYRQHCTDPAFIEAQHERSISWRRNHLETASRSNHRYAKAVVRFENYGKRKENSK